MEPVRKVLLAFLLVLVCLTAHGYAQQTMSEPVDARMRNLSVLA